MNAASAHTYPGIYTVPVSREGGTLRRPASLPSPTKPGLAADLVVFDPVNLQDAASYEQPRSYPQGIPRVVVNGELVVGDAETTGLTPGRALGRGQRS